MQQGRGAHTWQPIKILYDGKGEGGSLEPEIECVFSVLNIPTVARSFILVILTPMEQYRRNSWPEPVQQR
jgi:hypothetical protein